VEAADPVVGRVDDHCTHHADHTLLVDDAVGVMLTVDINVLVDVWRLRIRWWVELTTTALTSTGHTLMVGDAVGVMLSVGIKVLVDV